MKSTARLLSFLGGLLLQAAITQGAVQLSLPFVFSDNMVLQRDLTDPVWGQAAPHTKVTVKFAGQEKNATADEYGHWNLKLDPMPASADGRDMTVTTGDESVTFKNILIGEVWLCSGQSNMEKPIGEQRGQVPTSNAAAEIANANHPLIRLLGIPKVKRISDINTQWQICTTQTIASTRISAAGYFFGRKIQQDINVPVGLIHSSWGGTRIEPWINPQGFDLVPSLSTFASHHGAGPTTRINGPAPSQLYNVMINPLVPYGIRGAIWYQGESNLIAVHDHEIYTDKMKALISGWRQVWGEADFPFYYVQIAPYRYTARKQENNSPDDLPLMWQAQLNALKIPHTGMVVITDQVDNYSDIHPTHKREVGERLALWAEAKDYGKTDVICSGPIYQSLEIAGTNAIVHFDYGQGLTTSDGKPISDFEIAGADQKFVAASAKIVGDTVVVSSENVSAPAAVRFGWKETTNPNLVNAAGLRTSPFRSTEEQ